jgi:hypothetical protein
MKRLNLLSLSSACALAAVWTIASSAAFAETFKVGDVVEVDDTGMNYWERAVIMPFKPGDTQDGNTYRVKREKFNSLRDPAGEISQTIHIRYASSASAATTASAVGSTAAASATTTAARTASSYSQEATHSYTAPRINTATASTSSVTSAASASGAGLNPRMNGAFPSIPGTGWDLMGLQKKGEASTSTPKSFAQSFSFCKTGRWSVTRYGLAAGQMGTYTVNGNKLVMINSLNNEPFGNFTMTWRGADKTLILDSGTYIWTLKLVSLNSCGEN